jgi:hypothetical protein
MSAARPAGGAAPPPTAKAKAPPYSRDLTRMAWRAWLTVDDEALAERLLPLCEGLPPWLDAGPWLALGVVTGAAAGHLAAWLLRGLWGPDQALAAGALALVLAALCGAGLARRDRRGEEARDFPWRLASLALHAPFVVLAAAAGLALVAGEPIGLLGTLVFAVLLLGLPVLAARAVTPCQFLPDYNDVWPPLADLDSLALRALASLAPLGAALAGGAADWVRVLTAFVAVGLIATVRWQEVAADDLGRRIERWPQARQVGRRARVRRRWLPPPYALEALLIARRESPDEWALAAVYSDARDYPPEALAQAAGGLWSGAATEPEQARAAALCALELWTNPAAGAEVAYRAFARLDAVAQFRPEALDERFWKQVDSHVGEGPRRAEAVVFLLSRAEDLGLSPATAWLRVRRLRWAAALAPAGDERTRLALLDGVLALHERFANADALEQAWADWEQAAERDPQTTETVAERWASRAVGLLAGALPAADPLSPTSHRHFGLALRWAGWRAADGDEAAVRAWYAAARRFEELPAVRQQELLTPFAYWSLWRQVLARAADAEEAARQEERYRLAGGKPSAR